MSSSDRLAAPGLAAARVYVTSRYPYLASALFVAPVRAAAGSGTVAVDQRWCIHADPAVLQALSVPELGRLLVHLLSHLLRDHAGRATATGVGATGGDPVAWNRAADAEVNDDLLAAAMVPTSAPDLPACFEADDGQLAEHYFGLVGPGPRHWDCGSGCDGVRRDWDARSGTGVGEREAGWLRLAVAAEVRRTEGLEPGTVPGGWMRWAERLLPSRVDWRRVLAAEVRAGVGRSMGMVDYGYRRPSRRAEAVPSVVLPILERPVPEVAVICDTSGSMAPTQLGRALVEVEALLRRAGLEQNQVRVLSCDAQVHAVRRVSRPSQIELVGGGGTDMAEGINQAAGLRPRPSVIVVLTDGLTPWPQQAPPGLRVIIGLIRSGERGPWGPQLPPPPSWARVVSVDDVG